MKRYDDSEVYEVLDCFDVGRDRDDRLQLWEAFCLKEGLLEDIPYLDGTLRQISDLGRLALHVHDQADVLVPPKIDWQAEAASRDPRIEKTISKLSESDQAKPNDGPSAKPRQKSTKEATTQKVNAAIAFKMQNPEWTETQCADAADLPVSTLNGRPEWADYRRKIEAAQTPSARTKVKQEFDRRIGESVLVDPDSE